MRHVRRVGAWLICGLIAGLLLGVGGRLAMRLVALAAHQTPAFSLGGTVGILLTAAIIGLASAALFLPVRAYTPGTGVWKGGLFGVLIMLLLLPILPTPVKDEIAAANAQGHSPVVLGLFSALFILEGVVVQVVEAWLLPQTRGADRSHGASGEASGRA